MAIGDDVSVRWKGLENENWNIYINPPKSPSGNSTCWVLVHIILISTTL